LHIYIAVASLYPSGQGITGPYLASVPISLRTLAHFPSWLRNRFYSLHPLGFMVATSSAFRPYGLSAALWVHRPSGLLATPSRWI